MGDLGFKYFGLFSSFSIISKESSHFRPHILYRYGNVLCNICVSFVE
ncbi:unnamed protein product [Brugia timori]|uniref:Uncharacterized protein n=1 Tax=Brugia timori TaxID=42155 RepID=A0A3P7VUZ8_9BILA|nr:unnamed protein product [Brugia timori]